MPVSRNENLERKLSTDSHNVLLLLCDLKEKVLAIEEELGYLEARVTAPSSALTSDLCISTKNDLAQLSGTLDQLQYGQVDAVVTAELQSGKENAKESRKSCNRKCEQLRKRILQLHAKLN